MTGFFEELSEVIMQVIIRPASIDPPPGASAPVAARALARSLRRTPPSIWGACALARSVLVPAIVPDKKTKAAERKQQVRVSLKTIFFLSR
jgi:hypothetical protein